MKTETPKQELYARLHQNDEANIIRWSTEYAQQTLGSPALYQQVIRSLDLLRGC